MDIVPVIDLKDGRVVHARRGERGRYPPLSSRLTASTRPVDVLRALLDTYPLSRVYIADLDAITHAGQGHQGVIQELRQQFPALELWIDNGVSDAEALQDFLALDLGTPVLGSESLVDPALRDSGAWRGAVLSLDYRGRRALGPAWIHDEPEAWPERLILMNLEKVGAEQGPDIEGLARLQAGAPGKRIYAAGGVRNEGDLRRLAELGAAGVLLASALHSKSVSAAALASYS